MVRVLKRVYAPREAHTKIYEDSKLSDKIQQDSYNIHTLTQCWNLYFNVAKCKIMHIRKKMKTRGQRPNESQKAVIIDMMKSVDEIASKMWPVV